MVGRIIGRQGDIIKGLQAITGARIQIDQSTDPCRVSITGSPEATESCYVIVSDIAAGGHTAQYSYAAYMSRTAAGAWAQTGGTPATGAYGGYPAYEAAAGGYPYAAPGAYPYGAAGGTGAYPYPYGYAAYPQAGQAAGQPAAAAAAGADASKPAAAAAQGQWTAADDGQGRTYYYNAATGVSQWEKPPDMA